MGGCTVAQREASLLDLHLCYSIFCQLWLVKKGSVGSKLQYVLTSRNNIPGTSLVVQWLRVCCQIQGTQV